MLIHKMDLVTEEDREVVFLNRKQVISDVSGGVELTFFMTSIWDETLYKVSEPFVPGDWGDTNGVADPCCGCLQRLLLSFLAAVCRFVWHCGLLVAVGTAAAFLRTGEENRRGMYVWFVVRVPLFCSMLQVGRLWCLPRVALFTGEVVLLRKPWGRRNR